MRTRPHVPLHAPVCPPVPVCARLRVRVRVCARLCARVHPGEPLSAGGRPPRALRFEGVPGGIASVNVIL